MTPAAHPPSVERVTASAEALDPLAGTRDRDAVVAVAREIVDAERDRLSRRPGGETATPEQLGEAVMERLEAFGSISANGSADSGSANAPSVDLAGSRPVINATGVLLHTNLGRAVWPRAAIRAAEDVAAGASFLEMDEKTGRRGPRSRIVEDHLIALTGADDALVVNNNAAAVAIAVGLAGRGGVAVSRGEAVEIGGGVRIPEIVKRAGARLVEVGTTNRTRVEDFEDVLAAGAARLILRVHPSNFVQHGFVESPDGAALAAVAHRFGAIVVDDLGSGALLDTERFGLAHEPTPRERLALGVDLVTFSGDKLVGGPQAGIVAGATPLIARLRRDPLARAMRPDKVILAALAATLGLYRAGLAVREIPLWRRVAAEIEELEARSNAVLAHLEAAGIGGADVVPSLATIGGGALPGQTLESRAIRIRPHPAEDVLARLRAGRPAVIGRIEDDAVLLDLRTVDPDEDAALASAIAATFGAGSRA